MQPPAGGGPRSLGARWAMPGLDVVRRMLDDLSPDRWSFALGPEVHACCYLPVGTEPEVETERVEAQAYSAIASFP